jgi:hypothetical protein
LAQQRSAGRTQQQKATRSAVGIDFRTQFGKKIGNRLHFVQNHELIAVPGKEQIGPSQLGANRLTFEIQNN